MPFDVFIMGRHIHCERDAEKQRRKKKIKPDRIPKQKQSCSKPVSGDCNPALSMKAQQVTSELSQANP